MHSQLIFLTYCFRGIRGEDGEDLSLRVKVKYFRIYRIIVLISDAQLKFGTTRISACELHRRSQVSVLSSVAESVEDWTYGGSNHYRSLCAGSIKKDVHFEI